MHPQADEHGQHNGGGGRNAHHGGFALDVPAQPHRHLSARAISQKHPGRRATSLPLAPRYVLAGWYHTTRAPALIKRRNRKADVSTCASWQVASWQFTSMSFHECVQNALNTQI